MKIVFMGTPTFAVPALSMISETKNDVGYVFTQPDKAKDRGKKIQFTPVKEKALELNIKVIQPEKIKGNQEVLNLLQEYKPDLIIVAAYGQILPKEVLEIPRLGCINIHGSLLPKYRGAAPIQRAIIEGENKTGITLMMMNEGLDTGDMLAKSETYVDYKTFSQLYEELSIMGGNLLIEKLYDIENQTIKKIKQDDSMATYAKMIFKEDGKIDFTKSAVEIERLIRGLNPAPCAHTLYKGESMKMVSAKVIDDMDYSNLKEGTIVEIDKDGFLVATGNGILKITEIQVPNKRKMLVEDYLKGNKIEKNVILGI